MAPQKTKLPASLKPMLGRLVRSPFDSPKHLFELKWDGMRGLAFVEGGELRLLSRNGRDITSQFPELGEIAQQVKAGGVLLDGEIVCLDEQNRPSFSRLQQRLQSKRVARPRINPAHFIAFDILYVKGLSVMKQPLMDRKNLLNEVLNPTELIQACEFVDGEGEPFFQATCDLGLEGIMAKDKSSPYLPGKRSPAWQKIKRVRESEFVVGGYSFGGTKREMFSALLLGLYDERQGLVYTGSVGTGFTQSEAKQIYQVLQALHTPNCPFTTVPELKRFIYWCHPKLVCQVEYGEFTTDGKLRYPVYLRPRVDKDPEDCTLSDAPGWPGSQFLPV